MSNRLFSSNVLQHPIAGMLCPSILSQQIHSKWRVYRKPVNSWSPATLAVDNSTSPSFTTGPLCNESILESLFFSILYMPYIIIQSSWNIFASTTYLVPHIICFWNLLFYKFQNTLFSVDRFNPPSSMASMQAVFLRAEPQGCDLQTEYSIVTVIFGELRRDFSCKC